MIEKKNIYYSIPEFSKKEVFEDILNAENLKVERIISYPDSIPENQWYDQDNEEWVLLLKGSATLEFSNNEIIELFPGDFILIPAHMKHKVNKVDKNAPTIWLALHYK
jgi:cupin 2 domain-containing protein